MTSRQFYFTIIIFTITLKIQKLPCLLYGQLGKDSIFLVLMFLVVDLIGIIAAYLLANNMKKKQIINFDKPSFLTFVIKLCLFLTAFYFLMQSILFYEAIQDLFSHVLFNNLSWTLFSLLLIFALLYLAISDLKIIGRNFELYFALIVMSLGLLTIFGAMHADFTNIFPLQTIVTRNFFESFTTFNLWFGDFVLIFLLTLNTENTKLRFTILSYVLSMIFVILLFVELNGIFFDYTAMQPSLISIISEQSLLGVDIGRLDWFCILISEIGAVLSSALCLCFTKRSLKIVFPKINPNIVMFVCVAGLYLLDVIYLVDTNAKEILFMQFADIYSLISKIVIFAILIVVNIQFNINNKKKKVSL